ncbi:MAG: peptidase S41 [Prevotellaceae bacterium]|jgi:Tol biopolymer transport system component/C-terminal processing protease CtpA/Prc|nr:peptidase S41 [Prevotellaceae bacterium]
MKTLKLTVISLFLSIGVLQANPLWMRYPSISPDGKQIAFSYKGDIYTVVVAGGEAKQITMHEAHDYIPVWSPDSKSIAFASNRYGSFNIFLVPAAGGTPVRLTNWSGGEQPYSFTPDGKYIVFGAKIQAPAKSAAFPSSVMSELYSIPVTGGRPEQILATPAEKVKFTNDGKKFVFQDKKGQENQWRKHHTSSVTRDIWMYDISTGKFRALIVAPCENTDPILSPDNTQVYFLSTKNGSYNVFSFPLDNSSSVKQITDFKTHPVRFLSIANTGMLCFGYEGEIYILAAGGKPEKVKIQITGDSKNNEIEALTNKDAVGAAISTDGKQVAIVMRGEIFVASTDYKYTKRITNTAAEEDYPKFSPDGKTLIYASQRDGFWNIYTAKTTRPEEPYFFNATVIEEQALIPAAKVERCLPQYSPDGKEIAYIESRSKLMVYNIESKKIRQITDGSTNYDSDGMINYAWSPDSKWFTIQYTPNRHHPYTDIGFVSAQGGAITNLTNSGYTNGNPKWVLDGDAIMFRTERYGMRNHASWGSMNDVMLVFMNRKAFDKFHLSDDDFKLFQEDEKAKKKDTKADSTKKETKDIVVELKGIEDRLLRLTPNSSTLGDAVLDNNGEKLYYLASFEQDFDLWSLNCRTKETKVEIKKAGRATISLDKEGKTLFLLGRAMQKYVLASSKKTPIAFNVKMDLDLIAEREFMFNHVVLEEAKRFYVVDMHGVDWPAMTKSYAKFLPYINNNFDFAELLNELLGELNVSHTGSRYTSRPANSDAIAQLGLLFSWNYDKDGLLIDEVLEKGSFDKADSKVVAGCVLEKINGVKIEKGKDYFSLLNKKAGEIILVSCYNPKTNERWDETVKPITVAAQNALLYGRWVKQREADVERLSNGRLGYVHIESMGDPSFRSIYSDILGKYNDKEGIVIDTRFNRGGRLHEDIEVLFSGKKYFTQVVQGKESCDMPSRRWNKASIMVMGEANYSNAHGTPWVYKNMGIGKLVGMPVPGTMTSVNWVSLQDPSLVFGIPVVGCQLADGSYLENQQLEPDVKVANSPDRLAAGEDEQLAAAVRELLKEL